MNVVSFHIGLANNMTEVNAWFAANASAEISHVRSENHFVTIFYRNIMSTRVTGNTTVVIKSGAGILESIFISNNQTGGAVVVYDNTAASGTVLMRLLFGSAASGLSGASSPGPFSSGRIARGFSTGLTVVTSGSASNDISMVYE